MIDPPLNRAKYDVTWLVIREPADGKNENLPYMTISANPTSCSRQKMIDVKEICVSCKSCIPSSHQSSEKKNDQENPRFCRTCCVTWRCIARNTATCLPSAASLRTTVVARDKGSWSWTRWTVRWTSGCRRRTSLRQRWGDVWAEVVVISELFWILNRSKFKTGKLKLIFFVGLSYSRRVFDITLCTVYHHLEWRFSVEFIFVLSNSSSSTSNSKTRTVGRARLLSNDRVCLDNMLFSNDTAFGVSWDR